jgi:hypothetical protein
MGFNSGLKGLNINNVANLREEHRVRVSEKSVMLRIYITVVIKSRIMRWARHVPRMGERRGFGREM